MNYSSQIINGLIVTKIEVTYPRATLVLRNGAWVRREEYPMVREYE